jgi:dienelactone hydrolase
LIRLVLVAALALLPALAPAKVVTKALEYRQGDTVLEGVLAWDDAATGKRPGILVIHDWKGLGPEVKRRAEMLAKLGYVALAADIYGKGVRPATPEAAGQEAGKYRADRALLRARARAGLDALAAQPQVDTGHLAAMGYCFGGGATLELARSGAPLRAALSFHGNLDTPSPAKPGDVKAKILVLHGAADPHVPPAQVIAFEDEMQAARVDFELIAYGGAVHAFTNPEAGNDPSKGAAYDATADRRSWEAMQAFLREAL